MIQFRARPRVRKPHWKHELALRPPGLTLVAGVDEVGRGCWAGPVLAAAVILPERFRHRHLNDSKKLVRPAREELGAFLCAHPEISWSIGSATLEEIETLNILGASLLAMRRAVAALTHVPELCLVDGNRKAGLGCLEVTVIGGDARCPSIAAASVIAKVTRDRAMVELAALYPQYGLENHCGYGTPEHQHALTLHGPSPIHRRTFRPVRARAGAALRDDARDGSLW